MILTLLVLLAQQQVTGERSIVSKCAVAEDATYGYSRANPIKVGGTPMYGPARQRRFLQVLVGPAGQPVTFKRRGSMAPDADNIILDLYDVTIAGVEKPIELYLDLYRWDPPKAPQGFLCSSDFGLVPPDVAAMPPPAPGPRVPPIDRNLLPRPLTWDRMLEFAMDWGPRHDHAAIPLDASAPARYGVVFDPYTRAARLARAAAQAGKTVSRDTVSAVRQGEGLFVAFPLDCGSGRLVKPKSIDMVSTLMPGRAIERRGGVLQGDELARALPAFTAPEGSIGVMLVTPITTSGQVTIGYDGPACSDSTSVKLDLRSGFSGRTLPAVPAWPEGVEGAPGTTVQVTVHAILDADGVAHEIRVVDGPEAFHAAAIEIVRAARHGAMTVNGVVVRTPRSSAQAVYFRR